MATKSSRLPVPKKPVSMATRVRAVPDFSKLHNQWSVKLEQGKACTKKPCTVVHEFGLSQPGMKTEHTRTRSINSKPLVRAAQDENSLFVADRAALDSIVNQTGIPDRRRTGRATIAASRVLSKKNEPRQSEYFARTKVQKTPTKQAALREIKPGPAKRKASSPLAEETNDVFTADPAALQSIIENKGVCMNNASKTPTRGPQKTKVLTDVRNSMYSRVAVEPKAYSEFTSRIRQNLLWDIHSPGVNSPAVSNDPYQIYEPIRNSMYVRCKNPAFPSNPVGDDGQHSARKRLGPKAQRVLVSEETPTRQSSLRKCKTSQRKSLRWKDIFKQKTDELATKLDAQFDEESEKDTPKKGLSDTAKLKSLEEKCHKYEKEIAAMEKKKEEKKQHNKDQSSNSPNKSSTSSAPMLLEKDQVAPHTKKNIHKTSDQEQQSRRENVAASNPPARPNPRPALSALSSDEITARSINLQYDSDSDSSVADSPVKNTSCGNAPQKYPQSPLSKDSSCQQLSPYIVAHGATSKVRGNSEKSRSRPTQKVASPAPTVRTRDIWSPSCKKSPLSKAKTRYRSPKGMRTPPRSPKNLAKDNPGSPLYSQVMSKTSTSHSVFLDAGYDKENQSPAVPLPNKSPVVKIFNTLPEDPLSMDECSAAPGVDQLNYSLAEISFKYEELEEEAIMLSKLSVDDQAAAAQFGTDFLLSDLKMVKQKQQELLFWEKQLKGELFKQKYGSTKLKMGDRKPGSAKKKLNLAPEESRSPPECCKQPQSLMKSPLENITKISAALTHNNIARWSTENDKPTSASSSSPEGIAPSTKKITSPVLLSNNIQVENASSLYSPKAIRPTPNATVCITPSMPKTFSPKPTMAGSAQVISRNPVLDAPIRTPLVLRSAAHKAVNMPKSGADTRTKKQSAIYQNSPIDLSRKSNSSSANTSSSDFSPDVTFSYLDVKENDENSPPKTTTTESGTPAPPLPPRKSKNTDSENVPKTPFLNFLQEKNTDVVSTPAKSSTKSSTIAKPVLGSLSLFSNLASCSGPKTLTASPLHKSCALASASQRYHDTLLDDEVSLFMSRLSRSPCAMENERCCNPLAKILDKGDDMHFIPIRPEKDSIFMKKNGSAFLTYCG